MALYYLSTVPWDAVSFTRLEYERICHYNGSNLYTDVVYGVKSRPIFSIPLRSITINLIDLTLGSALLKFKIKIYI